MAPQRGSTFLATGVALLLLGGGVDAALTRKSARFEALLRQEGAAPRPPAAPVVPPPVTLPVPTVADTWALWRKAAGLIVIVGGSLVIGGSLGRWSSAVVFERYRTGDEVLVREADPDAPWMAAVVVGAATMAEDTSPVFGHRWSAERPLVKPRGWSHPHRFHIYERPSWRENATFCRRKRQKNWMELYSLGSHALNERSLVARRDHIVKPRKLKLTERCYRLCCGDCCPCNRDEHVEQDYSHLNTEPGEWRQATLGARAHVPFSEVKLVAPEEIAVLRHNAMELSTLCQLPTDSGQALNQRQWSGSNEHWSNRSPRSRHDATGNRCGDGSGSGCDDDERLSLSPLSVSSLSTAMLAFRDSHHDSRGLKRGGRRSGHSRDMQAILSARSHEVPSAREKGRHEQLRARLSAITDDLDRPVQ